MAAFADSSDMVVRYDTRTLGDLCSDDGNRVAKDDLATSDIMTTALSSATGEIKAATLRAERYTVAQLEALTGESQEYLKTLTCAVAFWRLWSRKPYNEKNSGQVQARTEFKEAMERIRSGDHIFEVAATAAAGTPNIDTITRAEIQNDWDLFVDNARGRFYPRRRSYRQR